MTALAGQTVVVLGGSAGIGLETARAARAEGARVILNGRDGARLARAVEDVGAAGSAAFDATDPDRLAEFLAGLAEPVDHLLASGSGPYYGPLAGMDFAAVRRDLDQHLLLPMHLGQLAPGRVLGSLTFIGGTGGRQRGVGRTVIGALTAAMPAIVENMAVELAPLRVNLVAPGFVDTALSARLLGDQLEARRAELRATLPIRRVVGPQDVAAVALHLMVNTAVTGATYDVDGGQKLL